MIVGRWIGWAFLALAIVAFGHDLWMAAAGGGLRLASLGELWYRIDVGSLNLSQAVVQRYLAPALWDPVIVSILVLPGAVLLAALGLLLIVLFRRRRR